MSGSASTRRGDARPRPAPPRLPGQALWLLAGLLVVLLGAVGWIAGQRVADRPAPPRAAQAPQPSRTFRTPDLALQVDPAWSRAPAARPVPGFGDATALALSPYPGLPIVVNAAVLPVRTASLLPRELARVASRPERGRVGGLPAWRYTGLRPEGWALDAAVVPTTAGVITLTCGAPQDQPPPSDDCLGGIARVVPVEGAPLHPSPQLALRVALPGILKPLNATRRATGPGLRSRSTRAQAVAARRLARAHARAAAAVAPFVPAEGTGSGLGATLRAGAAGYGGMAAAGRRKDPAAWRRSRSAALRADARLARIIRVLGAGAAR